jgi:hypothetical protein
MNSVWPLSLDRASRLKLRVTVRSEFYILVARDDFQSLCDERLRRELEVGFEQADRGDVADWDLDEMLCEARRRRDSQTAH